MRSGSSILEIAGVPTLRLIPADATQRPWLDELRREVYRDLVLRTFGDWDENRHQRHCEQAWSMGNIYLVADGPMRIGMLQLEHGLSAIHVHEIQLSSGFQNRGLGSRLLDYVVATATRSQRDVTLDVAHLNTNARRLYRRLGFIQTGVTTSHYLMRWSRTGAVPQNSEGVEGDEPGLDGGSRDP